MKSNVQYLLECYYGERLLESPNVDYCSESEGTVACDPVTTHSVERSSESEEIVSHGLTKHADDLIQMIENEEINVQLVRPQNYGQMQVIREIGNTLKRAAYCLQIRPASSLLAIERAILLNEGLSDDEMRVVRMILSEKTPTTVSKIAEQLRKCLTSRTFHATLRYLCYSASSVPEELGAACELVKVIYPRIEELVNAYSIYNALSEFMEKKLEEMLH